jgi:hypothetical protein
MGLLATTNCQGLVARTQSPIHINRGALPAHLPRVHFSIEPDSTVVHVVMVRSNVTWGTTSVLRPLLPAVPQAAIRATATHLPQKKR